MAEDRVVTTEDISSGRVALRAGEWVWADAPIITPESRPKPKAVKVAKPKKPDTILIEEPAKERKITACYTLLPSTIEMISARAVKRNCKKSSLVEKVMRAYLTGQSVKEI